MRARLLGLVVAAALLAAPAAAHATLAFDVDPTHPTIWVSSSGDPAQATEVGGGLVLEVSPNGEMVAFEGFGFRERPELDVYDVETGETRTLLTGLRENSTFAWSPDSTELAAVKGRESRRHTLYVIDADGGGKTPIAGGHHFSGASFSPDGGELVFGLAEKGNVPNFRIGPSDIVRAPVTGGPMTALTDDQVSSYPLWGPTGRIAFVRENEPRRAGGGSIDELVTTNAHGEPPRTLVKAKSGRYVNGPFPVVWSPAGDTLIANYVGYRGNAVAVDVATAGQTTLGRTQGRRAFAAVALTADGNTVLGYLGGVEYGVPYRTIASIPITGGESTVLKRGAFSPSWGG